MNDFFNYKNNSKIYEVSWFDGDKKINIKSNNELIAFISKDHLFVVLENWNHKKLEVYSINGIKIGDIAIPYDKFLYRGVNYCHLSITGLAVILVDKTELLIDNYADAFQAEIDIESLKIGKKLTSYR